MTKLIVVIVQVLIAVVLVATLMPMLLATVPVTREAGVGPVVAGVALVVMFLAIRVIWPAKRS